MNTKFLRPVAAALIVASLAQPAIAESPGQHPAVLVAQSWTKRAIDPNTFIVQHPAGPTWVGAAPVAKHAATALPLKTASVWSK